MKHRDRIRRAAADYMKYCSRQGSNIGAFYATDINEIRDATGGEFLDSICMALNAGLMIGYKRAKAEHRKQAAV